jgi:hypothetical protein
MAVYAMVVFLDESIKSQPQQAKEKFYQLDKAFAR